mgnify:CR=1 FL=1
MSEPLLEIKNLVTGFETESGLLKAVDGVSFTVPKGTCVGIVGESGCGKSVTAMSIVRLVQAKETDMHGIRGRHIGVIFQEPMTALNPVHSIGRQIGESLMLHRGMNAREARDAAIQLLQRVRIPAPEQRVDEFPHQLSGGMRQRVVIAIALACHPELIIADEPTTALDVTVQAQILSLLKDLQAEMGSSSILITHDLGVIAQSCDSVVVMYAGRVVEKAPVRELFANPRHAYTKGLLASIPQLSSVRKTKLPTIPGQVASIADFVPGCRFCQRQGYPRTTSWKPAPAAQTSNLLFLPAMPEPLLQVNNLKMYFPVRSGIFLRQAGWVKAVDDVSFSIYPGETLGLVGESIGKSIVRLLKPTGGSIQFNGKNIATLSQRKMRPLRPHIQMVFQDPAESLNQRQSIGQIVAEPFVIHRMGTPAARREWVPAPAHRHRTRPDAEPQPHHSG